MGVFSIDIDETVTGDTQPYRPNFDSYGIDRNLYDTEEEYYQAVSRQVQREDKPIEETYDELVFVGGAFGGAMRSAKLGHTAIGAAARTLSTGAVSLGAEHTIVQPAGRIAKAIDPRLEAPVEIAFGIGTGVFVEDLLVDIGQKIIKRGGKATHKAIISQFAKENRNLSEQFFKDNADIIQRADLGDEGASRELIESIEKEIHASREADNFERAYDAALKENEKRAKATKSVLESEQIKELEGITQRLKKGDRVTEDDYARVQELNSQIAEIEYQKEFESARKAMLDKWAEDEFSESLLGRIEADIAGNGGFDSKLMDEAGLSKELQAKIVEKYPGLVRKGGSLGSDELLDTLRVTGHDTPRSFFNDLLNAPTRQTIRKSIAHEQREFFDKMKKNGIADRAAVKEIEFFKRILGVSTKRGVLSKIRKDPKYTGTAVGKLFDEAKGLRRSIRQFADIAVREETRVSKRAFVEGQKQVKERLVEQINKQRVLIGLRKQYNEIFSRAKKYATTRSLNNEYHEQLFNFVMPKLKKGVGVKDTSENMLEFLQRKAADPSNLGADRLLNDFGRLLSISRRKTLRDLTPDELKDFDDFIRAFKKVAVDENYIRSETTKTFNRRIISTMERTLTPRYASRYAVDPGVARLGPRVERSKMKDSVAKFRAGLTRIESYCRRIDGDAMGAAWRYIYKPFADAAALERKTLTSLLDRVNGIMRQYGPEDFNEVVEDFYIGTKTVTGDGLQKGWPVTRERVVAMALNTGNKGNKEALLRHLGLHRRADGEKLLDEYLNKVMRDRDWKFVEEVWKMLDETFPMLDSVNREITGFGLTKVDGHYYPLVEGYEDIRYGKSKSIVDFLMDAGRGRKMAAVRRYMLKDRVGGSRSMELSLRPLSSHLTDIAKVTSHWKAVSDVGKIIRSDDFKKLIDNNLGKAARDEFETWLNHMARSPKTNSPFIKQLRINTTTVALGLRPITAMKQTLSAITAVPEIGSSHRQGIAMIANGMWENIRRGFDYSDIHSLSSEMEARGTAWLREAQEAKELFDLKASRWRQDIRDFAYVLIRQVDQFTASGVWRAAYEDGIKKFSSMGVDAQRIAAADYADMIVRKTQPASMMKDLPGALRSEKEVVRLMTMFQGYYNVLYNQVDEMVEKGFLTKDIPVQQAVKALGFMLIAPAVTLVAARGMYHEVKGDKQVRAKDVTKELVKDVISHTAGTMPIVRDVVAYGLHGFELQGTPVVDALQVPWDTGKAIAKGDISKAWKYGALTAGYWMGLPSQQVIQSVEGAYRLYTGRTGDVTELFIKPLD